MLRQIGTRLFHSSSTRCAANYTNCDGFITETNNQVLWLKFNRPKKFNAITSGMYVHVTDTLAKVNNDNSIKAVVLTGTGDYYSSGNDLTNFKLAMQDKDGPRAGITKSKDILVKFVESLINLEKLLIAAVNGPAIGIPVTTLPLCDHVIASEKATFYSPFTSLGQCPEACSSITFPTIMGRPKSSELLLLNKKWDATKAYNNGLVSEIVKHENFENHLNELLYGKDGIVNSCYPNSLRVSKSLILGPETKKSLLETNQRECDAILKLWLGEECADALQKFFKRTNSA